MNKLAGVLTICLFITQASAQNYEPKILVLAPNETKYEKSFGKELLKINDEMKKTSDSTGINEYLQSEEFTSKPENIKSMTVSEIRFSEKKDFFRLASYLAYQYLSYRFYERFTNELILLSDINIKGELTELKSLADKENMQYILNFPMIELYKSKGMSNARINVQLYDNNTGKYLINKDYVGDWKNPGFEFTCQDKTIYCTINNALSNALSDVIQEIAGNSPTINKERELSRQRYDVLVSNYLSKPCNLEPLKEIIGEANKDLPLENIFQVLYDDSMMKFVAFSLEKVSAQDFKAFKDNKKDMNVNIISDKDIRDGDFLDAIPTTYAYIIMGVKHKNKWYYEKTKVTYFDAESIAEGREIYFNNLQDWNFFIENTALVNPDFWETGLFKKVRNLKEDPDWKKYGESIWKTDEANNRKYIGMYEIVANTIKRAEKEKNEKFEKVIKDEKLKPAYEFLRSKNPKEYSTYSEHALIYPSDRSVVIHPVLITNDQGIKTIHYFVLLIDSGVLFEWTYFQPEEVKTASTFGEHVVDKINAITDWNFSYDNLDDSEFWNKYVLIKEGDGYKYLKRVEL